MQSPWVTREQLDRIAGASNSPALVQELREIFGVEIVCTMESVTDRDGQKIQRGRYSLTGAGAEKAKEILATK